MTAITVTAGGLAALLVDVDTNFDAATETITIADPDGVVVVGPTDAGLGAYGSGVYGYVWSVPSVAAGVCTATVAGEISAVPTSATVTVYVTSSRVYETVTNIKDELDLTTTQHDGKILRALVGASRAVETATGGRRFWRDGVASARTYETAGRTYRLPGRPSLGEVLLVDDLATETGLVVEVGDGNSWSTIAASSVSTWPDNAIARAKAITGVVVESWPLRSTTRVRVTAEWGWPAVPDAIVTATRLQAMRLFARRLSPEGVKGSAEWGVARIPRLDPDLQPLVAEYVLPAMG